MTVWKPSEGLKRADHVVTLIEQAADACDTPLAGYAGYHQLRHRMVDVIATALDAALRDGSEAAAPASAVGNGHADPARLTPFDVGYDETVKHEAPAWPGEGKSGQVLTASGYRDLNLAGQIPEPFEAKPTKRRGRPKGSGKKAKAKTAPAEAAME